MRCDDLLPLIEKLADGEATTAERQKAEAHLGLCSSCQSHLRFLQALPQAASQASLPDPPDMYWDVLPRKIMSRIEKERGKARAGRFSRWLAPSRLRWAGALAAALVAAVVGLRVLEFPLATPSASSPRSVARSGENGRTAAISGPDRLVQEDVPEEGAESLTPVRLEAREEAQKERAEIVVLDDESLEFAARQRRMSEPLPPAAPEATQEFGADALSATGKAGQKKQDNAGESTDQRVMGGRLEGDLDELKSTQQNEENRGKERASTATPDESAPAAGIVAEEVQVPKRVATVPAADRDPPAQPVAASRTLRAQPALEEASSTPEEQSYRDLSARYPARDEPTGSSKLTDVAKEKGRDNSDVELDTECVDWREFLSRYPRGEREADARYRLALCSITVFERSPSNANRQRALEDGALYLDVATDETRAEAVRRAMERIEP